MHFLMLKKIMRLTLCTLLFGSFTNLRAESSPATKSQSHNKKKQPFEEIIVRGTVEKPYEFKLLLSEQDLSRLQWASTVDGLFSHSAGIDLKRQSMVGSQNERVRIRGLDERRLRIQMDGRSLHGAGVCGGYFVDWSSLTIEDVESIEVIRGAAPIKYGNTLGGVVNINTKIGSLDPKTILWISGGSLGSMNTRISHSWAAGPVSYNISAGHQETDGYLRNAFFERNTISGKVAFDLPIDIELRASARYSENKSGMVVYNRPDSPFYDSSKPDSLESALGGPQVAFLQHSPNAWGPLDWGDRSHWTDKRTQLDTMVLHKSESFSWQLQAYLLHQHRVERFFAVDDSRRMILQREATPENHNWGWKADGQNKLKGFGTHFLEYGMEGGYLGHGGIRIVQTDPQYFLDNQLPTDSSGKDKVWMLHGLYLQDLWKVTQWLDLELGVRADIFQADGPEENAVTIEETYVSPRLAVTTRPWLGGHISGCYRRAHRVPTIPEYYWWYSGYQPQDRPMLTAEKAHQWEIEVGHQWSSNTSSTIRAYHYIVDDYIQTIFGYRPSRVIYNIDRVDIDGVEWEGKLQIVDGLIVWVNYTWQQAKKVGDILDQSTSESNHLLELPRNKANLGVDYQIEHGFRMQFIARYVDIRKAVQGDRTAQGASRFEKMDPFVDLSISASYPILRRLKGGEVLLEVTAENILDHHFMEEYAYPMPGFLLMAGMKAVL